MTFLSFVEEESKGGTRNEPAVVDGPDAPGAHGRKIDARIPKQHLSNDGHVVSDELEAVGTCNRNIDHFHQRNQEYVASVTF